MGVCTWWQGLPVQRDTNQLHVHSPRYGTIQWRCSSTCLSPNLSQDSAATLPTLRLHLRPHSDTGLGIKAPKNNERERVAHLRFMCKNGARQRELFPSLGNSSKLSLVSPCRPAEVVTVSETSRSRLLDGCTIRFKRRIVSFALLRCRDDRI